MSATTLSGPDDGICSILDEAIRQSGGEKSRESAVSMAIGMYFSPAPLPAEKYDEVIGLLEKAGAGNPAGRSYHAAFGPDDKLAVFEVWETQAAFEEFGKTLMPILQQLGIDPGTPAVMPIHKVTVPPANGA